MLVDVAGDGDVSAGAVCLDAESVDLFAGSGSFGHCAPDVESGSAGRVFDVVRRVAAQVCGRMRVWLAVLYAVVEVDAGVSVA